jgi:hypothetical protein
VLTHYSPDLLRYYWDVERPAFLDQCAPDDLAGFKALWTRRHPYAPGIGDQTLAR